MQLWPFLISANPQLEYRPVVLPDFIIAADAGREISRAAGGFQHNDGEAIYMKGFRQGLGTVDMVFVVSPATGATLGADSLEPLIDGWGRPVRLIYGIVTRHDHSRSGLTKELLARAFQKVRAAFVQFWQASNWPPSPSIMFESIEMTGTPLKLIFKESDSLPKPIPNSAPALVNQVEAGSHLPEDVTRDHDLPKTMPDAGQKKNSIETGEPAQRITPTPHPPVDSSPGRERARTVTPSHLLSAEAASGILLSLGLNLFLVASSTIAHVIGIVVSVAGVLALVRSIRLDFEYSSHRR